MPAAWAWAFDTPIQWTKQVASHFAGTRNGLVDYWPQGIAAKGQLRSQFHHIIDIAPTVQEAAHITQPEIVNGLNQKPIEDVRIRYSFDVGQPVNAHNTPVHRAMRWGDP